MFQSTYDQPNIKLYKYENIAVESIICLFSHQQVENADYPLLSDKLNLEDVES